MKQAKRITLISLLTVCLFQACQNEKFTDKGIPEVRTLGVEVLDDGVIFHGEILSDGDKQITGHGFYWTSEKNPAPEDMEYVILGPVEGKTHFSVTVNSTIVEDQVYTLRAFIKAGGITSFGNQVTFTGKGSKTPELISVTPASAMPGDTVVIKGRYFTGNPSSCSVFFDDIKVMAESSTTEELKVIVPCSIYSSMNIRVAIGGILSSISIPLQLIPPIITGFSPLYGTFGDIVTIAGSGMPSDIHCMEVYFNGTRGVVTEVAKTSCKVMVPTENNVSPVTIRVKCVENMSLTDKFTLEQAVITNVLPERILSSHMISISGENFNPDPQMNIVEIGGSTAIVTNCTATQMTVSIPSELEEGFYRVSVTTIAGSPVTWDKEIEVVKSVWSRLADFPASGRVAAAGFAAGGRIYFGTGLEPNLKDKNDFWEFDPATSAWTRKMDFPVLITYATAFSIEETGYFTMGKQGSVYYHMLYRYDPDDDLWTQMRSNPVNSSAMDSPGFVINGKAYVPAGGEMYEYDPASDQWTKKSYPEALGYFGGGSAFTINGKGYLGVGWTQEKSADVSDFYEYDPGTDSWTRKASFPGTLRNNATSFSLPNGKGYIALGYSEEQSKYLNDVWEYDPVLDTWTRTEDFPGSPRFGARAVVVGSGAYIIGGYGGVYEKDMWLFSPRGK